MTDLDSARTTWNKYSESWSIPDERERLHVLEAVVTDGVEYTDPNTRLSDRPALSAYMAAFQHQAPGARFRQDAFRFRDGESIAEWSMLDANGNVVSGGISYGRFDERGRIVKLAGFFPR